jgi:acyl carrier protein
MSAEAVEAKVREILVEILGVKEDAVVPTARLVEDLQVTSIDQVDIIAEFENAYGISILDEEAVKITTVGEMSELLTAKVQEKESA